MSTPAVIPPFCHHVLFWLNEPHDEGVKRVFEKALSELLTIPAIKAGHFGTPAAIAPRPVVDGSYSYSLIIFFNDMEGHDAYQVHPKHLKFIEENRHLWNRVQIYDSFAVQS